MQWGVRSGSNWDNLAAFAKIRILMLTGNECRFRQLEPWGEANECLKRFEGGDGFRTEFEFMIGSGAKPG